MRDRDGPVDRVLFHDPVREAKLPLRERGLAEIVDAVVEGCESVKNDSEVAVPDSERVAEGLHPGGRSVRDVSNDADEVRPLDSDGLGPDAVGDEDRSETDTLEEADTANESDTDTLGSGGD